MTPKEFYSPEELQRQDETAAGIILQLAHSDALKAASTKGIDRTKVRARFREELATLSQSKKVENALKTLSATGKHQWVLDQWQYWLKGEKASKAPAPAFDGGTTATFE